jgi:hypothetical protein
MSKKTPSKWSVRTVNDKSGSYAIVKGRAYPEVLAGANPTRNIKADIGNREEFYRDPAVKLSDDDLDAIDGATGAPICYEHNKSDVVGAVHHSWIDAQDGRCLKVIARIPLKDEHGRAIARGERIVEEIRAGKITGFSVGYSNGIGAGKTLKDKAFHEISLVSEPFFEGCNLTVGVVASNEGGGNGGNLGIN